jgi:hypothetical protein
MRIAVWSGPRNLSTAMMYSFAARPDCEAVDEPFYAAYLHRSGADHPMRTEVLASQPTDPGAVAESLLCDGNPHIYQKHMAHHMAGLPLDWAEGCVHIHLIRHPARVIASYSAKREAPSEADLGFAAQAALYDRLGGVVVDTTALRQDTAAMLKALCAEIGLPWAPEMLSWPSGPKPCDGVWAAHWYDAVHRSTGFAGAEGDLPEAPPELLAACLPYYSALQARALRP